MVTQILDEEQKLMKVTAHRILIINGLLTLFAILILAFWVTPIKSAIRQMYRALKEQKQQLNELDRQIRLVRQLQTDYEKMKGLIGSPVKEFERGKLVSQLVSEVSELAAQCGLRVSSFQPCESVAEPNGRWVTMPIEVTMDGTMKALTHFLVGLRRMTPPTIVDRMAISTSQDGGERLRIQMRVSRYVLIESGKWAASQRSGTRMPR